MKYWVECMKKYADFSGRARRREYWMFSLSNFLILLALGFVCGVLGLAEGASALGSLYTLALLLPGLAVTVRRMHDTGHSGWMLLVNLIPIVGAIIFLVLLCSDSKPGENKYGPNPKGL